MSEQQIEEAENPVHETFMDRRTVILTGTLTHQSVDAVAERLITLQARSSDYINLIIDSAGGDTQTALRLCDLMSAVMTAPVRGIALGNCGSAATFIMLYCNHRVSTPYSRFLIHSGKKDGISIPIGQTTSVNLEQLLKEAKTIEEKVLRLYMSRLRPKAWADQKPSEADQREYVKMLINRGDQSFDDWMSAEEAIEVGLVTEIVHGKLNIFQN